MVHPGWVERGRVPGTPPGHPRLILFSRGTGKQSEALFSGFLKTIRLENVQSSDRLTRILSVVMRTIHSHKTQTVVRLVILILTQITLLPPLTPGRLPSRHRRQRPRGVAVQRDDPRVGGRRDAKFAQSLRALQNRLRGRHFANAATRGRARDTRGAMCVTTNGGHFQLQQALGEVREGPRGRARGFFAKQPTDTGSDTSRRRRGSHERDAWG